MGTAHSTVGFSPTTENDHHRREYATPNLHYPYGSFHRRPNHYPAHRNPSSSSRLSEMSLNPFFLFSFLYKATVKAFHDHHHRDFPCQDAVFLPSPTETSSSDSSSSDSEQIDRVIITVPELTYSLSLTTARKEETEESSVVIQEIAPAEKVRPPAKSSQAEEVTIIKRTVAVDQGRWIKHYSSRHRILLVGEGDFSFSAALAVAFGRAARMIATSLDSIDFLTKNYKKAASNIMELKRRMCSVMHGINARKMADHKLLEDLTFDRIIFNFPFAGFFKHLPRDKQLRRHRKLVSQFQKNAKDMLSENGEIHISHKTNGFYGEWNLECMASSHGLRLIEAVKFNHRDYPGYSTKRGFGGDKYFHCYPSKTYKFGHRC